MITTLAQFIGALPRDTFMISECDPEDGSRSYFPVEDLEQIPGDDAIWQKPIIVLWMSEDAALVMKPVPDAQCKVFVHKRIVFGIFKAQLDEQLGEQPGQF